MSSHSRIFRRQKLNSKTHRNRLLGSSSLLQFTTLHLLHMYARPKTHVFDRYVCRCSSEFCGCHHGFLGGFVVFLIFPSANASFRSPLAQLVWLSLLHRFLLAIFGPTIGLAKAAETAMEEPMQICQRVTLENVASLRCYVIMRQALGNLRKDPWFR